MRVMAPETMATRDEVETADRRRATTARGPVRAFLPQLLAGWFGALCAYIYELTVLQPGWTLAADLHRQIIDGTAPSPYRSRVLMPFIAEALSRVMPLQTAYLILYFILFPLAFCSLFALLRQWYTATLALLGTAVAAAVLPLALRDHYFQPGTWLELVLVIAALRLLSRPYLNLRLYGVIAVTAALTRETGMLLSLLLIAVVWPVERSRRGPILATAVVPVMAYGFVRLARGGGPPAQHDLLRLNLDDWRTAFVQLALFGAVLTYLAVIAWPHAPAMLRRATWIVPPYLVLVAIFGIWRETRLLVPLVPIALGIGLSALAHLDDDHAPSSSEPVTP